MSAERKLEYLRGLARESMARASLPSPLSDDPIADALIALSVHRRAAADDAWRAMTRLGLEVPRHITSASIPEHALERMEQEILRLRKESLHAQEP